MSGSHLGEQLSREPRPAASPPKPGPDPVAVVALNMGGPATQADVEPFLEALFADGDLVRLPFFLQPFQRLLARLVARRRGEEARRNYARIGGGSPILATTERQAGGAVARLRERGIDAHALVAMRYSAPRAEDAAARIVALGAKKVVAMSLYPQYSPATGGSSLEDLRRALASSDVTLVEVASFATAPFYLDAMARSVLAGLDAMGEPAPHVLFSAHGLPASYVKRGDPYRAEIQASFEGVARRLPKEVELSLSFQSRVGPLEWLRPYTDEQVRLLASRGVRRLLMVPLGFVSDHVETLYEMDLLYGGLAREVGITAFHRVPALNDDPGFVAGLGDLVFAALGQEARGKGREAE